MRHRLLCNLTILALLGLAGCRGNTPDSSSALPSAPEVPATDDLHLARSCAAQADHACVIRILGSKADSAEAQRLLIDAYAAMGDVTREIDQMSTYVSLFDDAYAARYEQRLMRLEEATTGTVQSPSTEQHGPSHPTEESAVLTDESPPMPPANFDWERIEVSRGLSRQAVERVIQRHTNEVRFCYQEALDQQPELNGRLQVTFTISSRGAVQNASVTHSTLQHAECEGCILQTLRRWTFPAPDGSDAVQVVYPFVFELG